ncbi:hypothetical protein ACWEQL_08385 [Kitasatospora sp. NPDC004240]
MTTDHSPATSVRRAGDHGDGPTDPDPGSGSHRVPVEAEHLPEYGDDRSLRLAVEAGIGAVPGLGLHRSELGGGSTWRVLRNLRAVAGLLTTGLLVTGPSADIDGPGVGDRMGDRAGWTVERTGTRLFDGDYHGHGWVHLLGRTAPLAFAASSPLLAQEQRASLALLLDELVREPFAGGARSLRVLTVGETLVAGGGATVQVGDVLRHGERTVVLLACVRRTASECRWTALDHDPSGVFGPVADLRTIAVDPLEHGAAAEWISGFTALLRLHGPLPRPVAWAQEFDRVTGIGRSRSALLLAAPPAMLDWRSALPTAGGLAGVGLAPAAAAAARSWLSGQELSDIHVALLPADPGELWRTGLSVAAAATAWARSRGRRIVLPEERQTEVTDGAVHEIEAVLNASTVPWITRTTIQRVRRTEAGPALVADDPAAVPAPGDLGKAVRALRWLAHHLPYGDPLRPLLPEALAALRRRVADPGLYLDLGSVCTVMNSTLPGELRSRAGAGPGDGPADALLACGRALGIAPGRDGETAHLRPGALTGAHDPVLDLLDELAAGSYAVWDLKAVRSLLGDDIARLVADGSAADEPAGWPQDPRRSAPALVAGAAAALGLGEDAATLYLQLLALPAPTDRNTARWTGWKPARMKAARAELASGELVVTAKRTRAGRGLFLPGGWQDGSVGAGVPLESWKAGLYPLFTNQEILPAVPAPELFALAWRRVTDGDAPGHT